MRDSSQGCSRPVQDSRSRLFTSSASGKTDRSPSACWAIVSLRTGAMVAVEVVVPRDAPRPVNRGAGQHPRAHPVAELALAPALHDAARQALAGVPGRTVAEHVDHLPDHGIESAAST